jgi:hypothetical protein
MTYERPETTLEEIRTIVAVIMCIFIGSFTIIIFTWCQRFVKDLLSPLNRRLYSEKWNRIQQLSHIEESRPLAIIYANSLLDHALKTLQYSGQTMSQRLASAKLIFTNEKQVSDVNQLRNQIAHDINMKTLSENETKKALQSLRQALVDLGAL